MPSTSSAGRRFSQERFSQGHTQKGKAQCRRPQPHCQQPVTEGVSRVIEATTTTTSTSTATHTLSFLSELCGLRAVAVPRSRVTCGESESNQSLLSYSARTVPASYLTLPLLYYIITPTWKLVAGFSDDLTVHVLYCMLALHVPCKCL